MFLKFLWDPICLALLVLAWVSPDVRAANEPSDALAAQPDWPTRIDSAGAMEPANLREWEPQSPADYSGHYVSGSITDGFEEILVTVHRGVGGDAHAPWLVDVFERDDRRGPGQVERDYRSRSFQDGPRPSFKLTDNGRTLFFAHRMYQRTKGQEARPVIVTDGGAYYVLEPMVPQAIVLQGRETPLKFEPWIAKDPAAYAGDYVCQSLAKGTREVNIVMKHDPKKRLPWSVNFSNTEEGTDTKYPDYEYSNCPLWQETWPHFDAHGTFLFVLFADPRQPDPKAGPALITEKGEVFVKKAESEK